MNDFLIFPMCVCVFLFLSSEKDVKAPERKPLPSHLCLCALPPFAFVRVCAVYFLCVCVSCVDATSL